MRVTTGYNPYAYRQQGGRGHSSRFAEVYANRATNKSAKTSSAAGGMEVVGTPISGGFGLMPFRIFASMVNTTRTLNADSKGDNELTGPQMLRLQETYNLDSLTPQARHSLLCDLTDMGVLSADEIISADPTKVEDVFSKVKAFKIGTTTQAEFQDATEVYKSDGRDPAFRGLEGDELFAAIVKKHNGGHTTLSSFTQMTSELYMSGLITHEQADMLIFLSGGAYVVERFTTESKQGYSFNLELFDKNYRVTMDTLLNEHTRYHNYASGRSDYYKVDEGFLKDFISKVDGAMRSAGK